MKKNFLFAAMSIMALASCSNDDIVDVNNGSGISFRTSLDKAVTRANTTNLQNLAAFNVTAIGDGKSYFTNLGVTSDNNGASWKTASTYYWPSYQLGLLCLCPSNSQRYCKHRECGKEDNGFFSRSSRYRSKGFSDLL